MPFFRVIGVSFLCMALLACQKKVDAPSPGPTSTRPSPSPVAHLQEMKPEVSFRRKNLLVWEKASVGIDLFRQDAVQTHEESRAHIEFLNGSQLRLDEKTLVIINTPPGGNAGNPDRAVLREGSLTGSTRRELWLLTSAALVKLKPAGARSSARASLTIKPGRKVRIVLDEGQGTLLKREPTTGKVQRTPLVENSGFEVEAPLESQEFGMRDDEREWSAWEEDGAATSSVPLPSPDPSPTSPPSVVNSPVVPSPSLSSSPKLPPVELLSLEPEDGGVAEGADAQIKGLLSGPGAKVRINGKNVAVSAQGEFQGNVALNLGANTVVIQIIRKNGSSIFKRLTLIRSR